MTLFGIEFGNSKSKQIAALTGQLNQIEGFLNTRFGVNVFPSYKTTENTIRYCTTDDIYSIVNLIASTAAMIPIYGYRKDGDNKLTDLPDTDLLKILLDMPFDGMSAYESYFAIYATKLIHGNSLMLKERPEVGVNSGKVTKLHYLAPQGISIKISNTFPFEIISYDYSVNGSIVYKNIPPSDIIHLKYFNPEIDNFGSNYWGLSPLDVLMKRLNRVDSNMDVSFSQLQNGGVNTIVYEEMDGGDTGDVISNRRDNYHRFSANSANSGGAYFAAGKMGAIQLGLKLADLQVAELEKIDFKKLCNVYKVSDRLFNNDATGSEISDKGARVALYTNAALPEVRALRDAFKRYVLPEFKGSYYLQEDISEIPELQTNYKELAEAFAILPIMIPNNIMDAFKYEKTDDPAMDKVYIKSGYTIIDDMAAMPPLPATADYGQPPVKP